MDEAELRMLLFRMRARAGIVEGLVLKLHLIAGAFQAQVDTQKFPQSLEATLRVLDEAAKDAEQLYLADPAIVAHDAVRALYADEFRDVVEKMKSRATSLSKSMTKKMGA